MMSASFPCCHRGSLRVYLLFGILALASAAPDRNFSISRRREAVSNPIKTPYQGLTRVVIKPKPLQRASLAQPQISLIHSDSLLQTPDGRTFALTDGDASQIKPGQYFQTPDGRLFKTADSSQISLRTMDDPSWKSLNEQQEPIITTDAEEELKVEAPKNFPSVQAEFLEFDSGRSNMATKNSQLKDDLAAYQIVTLNNRAAPSPIQVLRPYSLASSVSNGYFVYPFRGIAYDF